MLEGELCTTDGRRVTIRSRGSMNDDAGPDFLGCEVTVGGETLRGDVEIHARASGWLDHRHAEDPHYARVVLHAVGAVDTDLPIPTLPLLLYGRYTGVELWEHLFKEEEKFSVGLLPCAGINEKIPEEKKNSLLVKLAEERLQRKALRYGTRLDELVGKSALTDETWQQVFYEGIFDALGFSVNRDPMVRLARVATLEFFRREGLHRDAILGVLMGVGGFLRGVKKEDDRDTATFLIAAQKTWNTYRGEFAGKSMGAGDWKRLRTRPQNFPERRLAAGAEIILRILDQDLLSTIVEEFQSGASHTHDERRMRLRAMLEVEAYGYFARRYDVSSAADAREDVFVGNERLDTMIVNVIVPFVWMYAERLANHELRATVLDFSASIAMHESNKITRIVKRDFLLDAAFRSTLEEQGAIELYSTLCSKGKCTECQIGKELNLGNE